MRLLSLILITAATALAQPAISIDGIRNSASYANRGLLTSGIAQGSLFVIFGRNLGPSSLVQAAGYPLLTELGGVSVRINDTAALLSYVSATQIGAILPSAIPTGTATMTIRYNGQSSEATPFIVGRTKPGFYTRNQAGTGPVIAQNFITEQNQPLNSLLTPAKPGQAVTLWATGLGPVVGDEAARPLPGNLTTNLRYTIGGKQARVLYEGRSGCCAGVDQVVLEIPQGVQGCYVPLVATYPLASGHARVPDDGPSSNWVTISISADGSPCKDSLGLTGEELTNIKDPARVGIIRLTRSPSFDNTRTLNDRVAARFGRYTAADLLARNDILGLPPAGTCMSLPLPAPTAPPSDLDAGPMTITNSSGTTSSMNRTTSGAYEQDPAKGFLNQGTVKISAAGGSDIGPFEVEARIPPAISWSNRTEVPSNAPVRWTGGDPDSVVVLLNESYNRYTGLGIICVEAANAGTIPAPTGLSLIQIGYDATFGSAPDLTYLSIVAPPARFKAPGLDLGLIYTALAADSFYRQ